LESLHTRIVSEKGCRIFTPLLNGEQTLRRRDFFSDHRDDKLLTKDVVFVDTRYILHLTDLTNKHKDNTFIIETLHKLRAKGVKLLLFDSSDDSGCRYFDLIEHVDLIVKKQILSDKSLYLKQPIESQKLFVWSYGLTEEQKKGARSSFEQFKRCPDDQLHKLRVGWDIGLVDYRFLPLQRYYPINTVRLFNNIYEAPSFVKPKENLRDIDSSFRGQIKDGDKKFSYQINKLVYFFQNYSGDKNYLTGSKVSKQTYLDELKRSKTCVSPYGWGEVCYWDFEAIICGSLLIKPDMSHITTWPNIYKKDETYVPLQWDMSDLEETLNRTLENITDYEPYIHNAQTIYKKHYLNANKFINRFRELVQ
jgi:hypothetical protein